MSQQPPMILPPPPPPDTVVIDAALTMLAWRQQIIVVISQWERQKMLFPALQFDGWMDHELEQLAKLVGLDYDPRTARATYQKIARSEQPPPPRG